MILERIGLEGLFRLPLCLIFIQLLLLPCAARLAGKEKSEKQTAEGVLNEEEPRRSDARHFLHMAWLANPLSYVAVNTLLPLIPSIAGKFGLSTGVAGIVCSIWMFMRLGAFLFLRSWTKWHYRWSILAVAFILMIAGFIGIILARSVIFLVVAQMCFGAAIGLIYYSSLYYSMMASDNKEEHCGLHEAMIGLGLFVGPAFGAGSLVLLPGAVSGGVLPVGALLLTGFGAMVWMRRNYCKKNER